MSKKVRLNEVIIACLKNPKISYSDYVKENNIDTSNFPEETEEFIEFLLSVPPEKEDEVIETIKNILSKND